MQACMQLSMQFHFHVPLHACAQPIACMQNIFMHETYMHMYLMNALLHACQIHAVT